MDESFSVLYGNDKKEWHQSAGTIIALKATKVLQYIVFTIVF